jgi:phosphoribosylaminoimidazole-succinocarboxamide synthase
VESTALELYSFVSSYARERGIILADTKLEFGIDANGAIVLGDEAFTPDSSRFWPADDYRPGATPPSFDKQFVRDYCESLGWDKTDPGPPLPAPVVSGTRARYVEAFERLTELDFDDYLSDPGVVLG